MGLNDIFTIQKVVAATQNHQQDNFNDSIAVISGALS